MNQQGRAYVQRKVWVFDRKTSLALTNGSEIENPAIHNLAMGQRFLMLGPLALILLLACSNVATLFLSRTLTRRGEIAIRLALGVSRSRLAVMLLMESLLTVCVGGMLGMVLAYRIPLMIVNILATGAGQFRCALWSRLARLCLSGDAHDNRNNPVIADSDSRSLETRSPYSAQGT